MYSPQHTPPLPPKQTKPTIIYDRATLYEDYKIMIEGYSSKKKISKPNIIITVICISIFMLGMMKLSAKIPPKDEDDEHRII